MRREEANARFDRRFAAAIRTAAQRRRNCARPEHSPLPCGDEERIRGMRLMSPPARIGIIGAGWWAAANHIPALKANPDCEIVAVNRLGASELAEIQRAFGVERGFEDYREMLASVEMDGVVISSPHVLHFEHASAALARGCHVLVEKPMTTTRAGRARTGSPRGARPSAKSSSPSAGTSSHGPARRGVLPRASGGSSTSFSRWRMRSTISSPGSR